MKIVGIGEVLWDVVGAEEHLGGASFNFSAHARRLDHEVFFVSGVGPDERGQRILARMEQMGLPTRYVRIAPEAATGLVTVDLNTDGQPRFTLYRPAAYDFPGLSDEELLQLVSPPPDWIYFGTLSLITECVKGLALRLISAAPASGRFYDVNLRAQWYNAVLVRELLSLANVVKLNDQEISEVDAMLGCRNHSIEEFCRNHARDFGWEAICVTRGAEGCSLFMRGEYLESPGYKVKVADAIGAGDAFAAAFLHGYANGWPAARIADFANRVGALIASHTGAIPNWSVEEALALGR
ncbi:MAG: PfkB family carbohydrate kinase [Terriglobia bacterium]